MKYLPKFCKTCVGKKVSFASLRTNTKSFSQIYNPNEILDPSRFRVYYQPIVCYASGNLIGLEALLRYSHPQKGLLLPHLFLSDYFASHPSINLIELLLNVVGEHSCYFSNSNLNIPISINITAADLQNPKLINLVKSFRLNNKNVQIAFEITETKVIESLDRALLIISDLKTHGVKIYLDDFGTGFSNYDLLESLPFDVVKIDKSLIDKILISNEDADIVVSIINLLNRNKKEIIAEGVDNIDVANFLIDAGCSYFQGFGINKAISHHVIPLWAKKCSLENAWWKLHEGRQPEPYNFL